MADRQIQNRFPFTTETGHADGDDHGHDERQPGAHAHAPSPEDEPETMYWDRRTEALLDVLIRNGHLTADAVRREMERIETRTPMLGARVVARAWTDPAFKARLLADARAACEELGIDMWPVAHLTVLENTETVHHAVVCTLCSCYPRPLLGEPPWWYKSTAYRHRVVVNPRKVLAESFGTVVPEAMEVRVVDSTADSRFLVLPRRPAGTEGWPEEDLIRLITRDSMVGVAEVLSPDEVAGQRG